MKVIIITEAGPSIGFGHLARCSAIYEAFKEVVSNVSIVLLEGSFEQAINVFKGVNLVDGQNDRERVLNSIDKEDVILIDSYLCGVEFYGKVYRRAGLLVSIDDFCRIGYPGGIVLNGLIYADILDYPTEKDVKYLLGKQYVLLRKAFWVTGRRHFNKEIQNVLLTFGGSSAVNNLMKDMIDMLLEMYSFNIHAVSNGPSFGDVKSDGRLKVSSGLNAGDMKTAMENCDLCISGGGTTIHELAVTGTPTIGICFSDNQEMHLREWKKAGFVYDIGWFNSKDILNKVKIVLEKMDESVRIKVSNKGKELIDGLGARRVVEEVVKCHGGI
ncbi:MAG: glycosyltransferase [Candidatus Aadella gelida]|nr:glycosyltransferase [Candidatus Aadella gelida]